MLQLAGQTFTVGVLSYVDEDPDRRRPHASIYIPINIRLAPNGTFAVLAFLDTGAPYFIVGPDVIDALELEPKTPAAQIEMNTRLGTKRGFLDKIDLIIPAEDGDSLSLEVTVFACPEWTAGVFLGYEGCMSNFNFAVQPQANQFHFGPP